MSSVEERFELARKSVEAVSELTRNMSAIGVYDEPEFKAAAALLITLSRAMVVLDPEKTKAFSDEALARAKDVPGLSDLLKPKDTGLYL